ncbi:cold-shock protein [Sphingomicrobium nitratireducens]|uniref:cold-shock protein n=1 Tax=Sphingomicrobium nitratireducens TaxID=2964666 RepID=UPI00223FDC44|nr:cold-shock protein [Sphingomicrobium nitratireducens]
MTNYGKIASYDATKGTGTITPEKGGDALMFAKADLKQSDKEPRVDQRFGYETKTVDGGKRQAVNLQMSQPGNDQSRGH